MADEVGNVLQLHPDDLRKVTSDVLEGVRSDLRALFEETARGPAAAPPGRPPVSLDSLDAKQFERFKQDLLRDVGDAVRRETSDFLPEDDIDERIRSVTSAIDQRFDSFKTNFLVEIRAIWTEEINKLRNEFFEIFDDLEMPLEKGEKRRATREKLTGLIAMHDSSKQFKSEFWKSLRGALIGWLTAAIMGLAAYIGLKGGGPSH